MLYKQLCCRYIWSVFPAHSWSTVSSWEKETDHMKQRYRPLFTAQLALKRHKRVKTLRPVETSFCWVFFQNDGSLKKWNLTIVNMTLKKLVYEQVYETLTSPQQKTALQLHCKAGVQINRAASHGWIFGHIVSSDLQLDDSLLILTIFFITSHVTWYIFKWIYAYLIFCASIWFTKNRFWTCELDCKLDYSIPSFKFDGFGQFIVWKLPYW